MEFIESVVTFFVLLISSQLPFVRINESSPVPSEDEDCTFHNPIFSESWPDPYCYLHVDGYYYMPRREDDRRGIGLFRSRKLSDWRRAEKVVALRAPEGLMNLWAPEIHYLRGNFYMYFAMDDGDNKNHRIYVSRAVDSRNPMGNWTEASRMHVPGDADFWAIDATIMEDGNHDQLYLIWSGWPTLNAEFPQNIYIARLCGPERICSERVLLAEPVYSWEQNGAPLLEGPQILNGPTRNGNIGKTFLIYSASGSWTADYNLGMMTIETGMDPMNATNWRRHDKPVMWRHDEEKVYGVGHASFSTSPDGSEQWIVYHAMEDPDKGWDNRTARVERFRWNIDDGTPLFPRPSGFGVPIDLPSGENDSLSCKIAAE